MSKKKILNLPLKAKWYEMIESGEKKEEYRDLKLYWFNRLVEYVYKDKEIDREYFGTDSKTPDLERIATDFEGEWLYFKKFDIVKFSYGYTKRTMSFEFKGTSIEEGNIDWGAEPGKYYFIIKLGKRL